MAHAVAPRNDQIYKTETVPFGNTYVGTSVSTGSITSTGITNTGNIINSGAVQCASIQPNVINCVGMPSNRLLLSSIATSGAALGPYQGSILVNINGQNFRMPFYV